MGICGHQSQDLKTKFLPDLVQRLPASLAGKSVAITGTTSGTGQVAARVLAEKGARVLLLNRPSARSIESFDRLRKQVPSGNFIRVDCDLQSFESVRTAAAKVHELAPSLFALCNNAGVMALPDKSTADGYDMQMQTNHLSAFLLTKEVWRCLQRGADEFGEARVVFHTSVARFGGPLEAKYFEAGNGGKLGGDGNYLSNALYMSGPWTRYHQSKLANAVMTHELSARLGEAGSKVKALYAHPGFAATRLAGRAASGGGLITSVGKAQTEEDGACGIISAMALDGVESGQLYAPGPGSSAFVGAAVVVPPEPFETDREQGKLLWRCSEEAVGAFQV